MGFNDIRPWTDALVEAKGFSEEAEGARGVEAVAEGLVGGAFGEEEATGFAVGGSGVEEGVEPQGGQQEEGEDYNQDDFCFSVHNIFCILMLSMKWLSSSSHSLKRPHSSYPALRKRLRLAVLTEAMSA